MSETMELFKIIELRSPIKSDKSEYTQIDLKPPTIGQRRKAEGKFRQRLDVETQTLYAIQLVSMVSGIPEAAIEQMDADQFEEAYQFVQGFSERGRTTGSNSG